jgi:hypothetical protein
VVTWPFACTLSFLKEAVMEVAAFAVVAEETVMVVVAFAVAEKEAVMVVAAVAVVAEEAVMEVAAFAVVAEEVVVEVVVAESNPSSIHKAPAVFYRQFQNMLAPLLKLTNHTSMHLQQIAKRMFQ